MNMQFIIRHEIDVTEIIQPSPVCGNPEIDRGKIFNTLNDGVYWKLPSAGGSIKIKDLESILNMMKEFEQWPIQKMPPANDVQWMVKTDLIEKGM